MHTPLTPCCPCSACPSSLQPAPQRPPPAHTHRAVHAVRSRPPLRQRQSAQYHAHVPASSSPAAASTGVPKRTKHFTAQQATAAAAAATPCVLAHKRQQRRLPDRPHLRTRRLKRARVGTRGRAASVAHTLPHP
eukprot:263394-Chlamydomonas_euryale.AAC.2